MFFYNITRGMTYINETKIISSVYNGFVQEWYFLVIVSVIIWIIIYYYLWIPKNWTKDIYAVGYTFLNCSNKMQQRSALRRARKIGNLPPVFPNGWFAIAESNEVHPSKVIYRTALGQNFAIFRTPKGICHVLDAYCPHLGANMAIGGQVYDNCLECPFHGWRFNGITGKCVSIPSTEKIPNNLQVKRWDAYEINDFIFIWYHADNEEPKWYPKTELEIKNRHYKYRGRNENLINCHIQEVPENGSDMGHFNFLHGVPVLSGSSCEFNETIWLKFFRHVWNAEWLGPSEESMSSHNAYGRVEHSVNFFKKINLFTSHITICQSGPGYVVLTIKSTIGMVILLQTVTPVEPLVQKIVHRIYSVPSLFIYASIILKLQSIMLERDILVWNHKKFLENPALLKTDKPIAKFRKWYSQFYSQNSPLLADVNSLEW